MADDPSGDSGSSAGSHLLQLISRSAPRLIGAAWVVAEAAARRVADVIQAVRAQGEPAPHPLAPTQERSAPEPTAAAQAAEPTPEPVSIEPPSKGQTVTQKKRRSKKPKPTPKPGKRAAAKAPATQSSQKKPKSKIRTAKKSKS